MKKTLLTLALLPILHCNIVAQCQDVAITDVRYSAFDQNTIMVYCQNNSETEIFSYPGFVLRNAQNDSVAGEVVNFFGLAGEHVSPLGVAPGQATVTGNFTGTLELWTGFYETLACTFNIDEPLCPVAECNQMILTIMNMGGAITLGTFQYEFTPTGGGPSISGSLTLDNENQMAEMNVCLPNGAYNLTISSQDAPLNGQPILSIREAGPYGSPELTSPINNQDGSATLDVPVYLGCMTDPNSVTDARMDSPNVEISQISGGLMVNTHGLAGSIEIFDLRGASVSKANTIGQQVQIPMNGIGVMRFTASDGRQTSQKVMGF